MSRPFRSTLEALARRVVFVWAAWSAVALAARYVAPQLGFIAGGLLLGWSALSLLRSYRQHTGGRSPEIDGRRISSAAVLLAGAFTFATLWPIRERLPGWVPLLAGGALVHYWLISITESFE